MTSCSLLKKFVNLLLVQIVHVFTESCWQWEVFLLEVSRSGHAHKWRHFYTTHFRQYHQMYPQLGDISSTSSYWWWITDKIKTLLLENFPWYFHCLTDKKKQNWWKVFSGIFIMNFAAGYVQQDGEIYLEFEVERGRKWGKLGQCRLLSNLL